MDLSDEALVANFRKTKDPTIFRSLVRRYEGRLYNAALRIVGNSEEAEDIVQDTCLKLHTSIDQFRCNSTFAAWIFRIAHNSCMDRLRKRRRQSSFKLFSFDPQALSEVIGKDAVRIIFQAADPTPNPAERLDMQEEDSIVMNSLKKLPEIHRTVVVLHDIENFTYQEIAEITGSSVGTVRSRLHYGRTKLREILEPYFSGKDIPSASR